MKAGIEALSGLAMDDVRVHRNSARPAALGARAYARGHDIHLAPGEERHLAHEAWHVVQQRQGRVRPTMRLGNIPVGEHAPLEREADAMAARLRAPAMPLGRSAASRALPGDSAASADAGSATVQRQSVIGTGTGIFAGAALGAALGSFVPVVGTAWGAAAGGMAGLALARWLGGEQKKKKKPWALDSVRNAAKKLENRAWKGHAVHHKIPRHELEAFDKKLQTSGSAGDGVRTELGRMVGASTTLKQLHNMPGNLEVGPPPERRSDDPGPGFDPNYTVRGSGALTPRSQTLHGMRPAMAMSPPDWKEVQRRLKDLKRQQDKLLLKPTSQGQLTAPVAWVSKGGKFAKPK